MSETTTAATAPTRTLEGHVLPAAGRWDIDPGHTDLAFVGRHFMVTKVRGRFTDVTGSVVIADPLNDSSGRGHHRHGQRRVRQQARDEHIKSTELFDVVAFPTATFRSRSVDWRGTGGTVHGDLTIRGVTRQVPLAVTFEGYVRDPWGGDRGIFSARTKINREDYGITWNVALEAGGLLVSKDIQIEIELETVLARD